MVERSLADALADYDRPLDLLRDPGRERITYSWDRIPLEHTNWIEEQRAWRETCSLADQSHHMVDQWIEGPEAIEVLADLGANDLSDVEPGQARQYLACNPDGYLIGDGILFCLRPWRFRYVGAQYVPNWIEYHVETGEYDATTRREENSALRDGPPSDFRYQLQGPNAIDVMAAAIDGDLPDVPFFDFAELSVEGRSFRALRHGMSGEAGYECWGPWEDREVFLDAVIEAGADHGLRRIGRLAYGSSGVLTAWVGNPTPAVYDHPELAEYREWLPARSWEGTYLLSGSFEGEDVTDYYYRPGDLGYDRFVDLDRDFVGRDALAAAADGATREKVTLVWDEADTVDVFASLYSAGPTGKLMRHPALGRSSGQDAVLADGEVVGHSTYPVYSYNHRANLSIGIVDPAYAEPGSEVTLVWGEADGAALPGVEPHEAADVRATVRPAPIGEDLRR